MSKINRTKFFEEINCINKEYQFKNINFIFDKFEGPDTPLLTRTSELAYVLATIYAETNKTMNSVVEGYWIPEYKRKSALLKYYQQHNPKAISQSLGGIFPYGIDTNKTYEGRGFAQTTFFDNYIKFSPHVKKQFPDIDIVENPELILNNMEVAWILIYEGMTRDDLGFDDDNYTGYTLEQFFSDVKRDFLGARKIISGKNNAKYIGQMAETFFNALDFE